MFPRSIATYALCLLPIALSACGDKTVSDPRTESPLVKTASVQRAPSVSQSFTGIVGARVESDLGFRVSGKVLQRLVDAGQTVKRGEPLMRIDPIDLGLEAQAQTQAVAAAKARAKQAADDEARYRDLVGAGAVSASAYDQMKAAADTSRAQLSAAEAQSGVAKNASSYAVLLADSDGVIVETMAEPGQVVTAGQIVARLAHSGPREAIIQLPETVRPAIASRAEAALYGADGASSGARLRQLSNAADRLTRTYEARYVLDGAAANAPLGSTVTVRLSDKNSEHRPELQVPAGSIFDSGKETGVWILAGKPLKVTWRPVHVSGVSDEFARVEGNLKAGDQIVAIGAHLLHEGEQVRIAEGEKQPIQVAASGAK